MMSSIKLLFTKVEKNNLVPKMSPEPTNAPVMIAKLPDKENNPALPMELPKTSITNATPKLAPVLIPKIDGPARGLLNAVWSRSPDTDKAAPQSKAVKAWGSLDCRMMKDQLLFSVSLPKRILHTERMGMDTEPNIRLHINRIIIISNRQVTYICPESVVNTLFFIHSIF